MDVRHAPTQQEEPPFRAQLLSLGDIPPENDAFLQSYEVPLTVTDTVKMTADASGLETRCLDVGPSRSSCGTCHVTRDEGVSPRRPQGCLAGWFSKAPGAVDTPRDRR